MPTHTNDQEDRECRSDNRDDNRDRPVAAHGRDDVGDDERLPANQHLFGQFERPDPVRNYSAGMRKRLGFARLLAQQPRLALIDEPYGQLDPEGFRRTEAILERLRADGVTLVIASHLVERAAAYCDRALLLDSGLPRWLGPAGDITRAWSMVHARPEPELAG